MNYVAQITSLDDLKYDLVTKKLVIEGHVFDNMEPVIDSNGCTGYVGNDEPVTRVEIIYVPYIPLQVL